MSWSLSVPATPAADFPAAIEKARAAYDESVVSKFGEDQKEPSREQILAAVDAANAIVDSGVVGDHVSASLGGHANKDHKPSPSWANECVSISITYSPAPTDGG